MEQKKENLLFIENLYKAYGEKVILDDIDLSVTDGEFLTVVGPSGCGKSTLLRLILGQELQTSGTLNFLGAPIGFSDTRRGIVYQKYSLFPHLTVLENVMLGRNLEFGFFKPKEKMKAYREEAMEFLKRMRLGDHWKKFPHELSGGMQQRVAIAQALIMRPKILLMDEPFGALDPGTREDMQIFILEIWAESKMTVFFVTHDLEEAVFLGTRVIVLSQFYTDGRGVEAFKRRGARIVSDYPLKIAESTGYKQSDYFTGIVAKLRKEGFDPEYRQHVAEFNLKHKDSFQSLSEAEKAK